MKSPCSNRFVPCPSRLLFLALTSLCLCSLPLRGQAPARPATPAELARYDTNHNGVLDPAEKAAETDDEAKRAKTAGEQADSLVVLSPFEVTGENTRGYYAANTMSGTRLNTKLEDLASSISIVTKEQMQDFALLDMNDIFSYEVSTEGTGNYTDFLVDRRGNVADNISDNPVGANRIRGVGPANTAFGNFQTSGRTPIDPTMLESVEISRGPNSNIFGLGNAAGTVNLVPAAANLFRNRTQVEFRADSYDGNRGSLDINRVLKKGVLAIRGSAVFQHDGFERKPSGTDTQRYNAMVKFQPFKNTTLRAGYYYYYLNGTRANTITPRDGISYWKSVGSPSWDPSTFTLKRNGVTVGTYTVGATLPDYLVQSTFVNHSQLFIDQSGLNLWSVGQTPSTSNPNAPNSSDRYLEPAPFPVRTNQPLFATTPAVSDKSLYDWDSINLGATNFVDDRDNLATAELEQIFVHTPRQLLAAQLGWFREDAKRYDRNLIGSAAGAGVAGYLNVDINERLLDGTPNPYFGRPYIGVAEPLSARDKFQNNTYRAQVVYELDFRHDDGKRSWLGQHQLSGYYEFKDSTTRVYRYRDVIGDVHSWLPAGNPRGNQATNAGATIARGYFHYYLGDNVGNNVDYAPTSFAYGTYPFVWYNGSTKQWVSEPATLTEVASQDNSGGTQNQRRELKTDGLVLQSHLVRDRVVTTFGLRQDKSYTLFGAPSKLTADGLEFDYPATNAWAGDWLARSGRTKTAGVVVKVLPWLNFYANKSDSFQPTTPSQNVLRQELPNPQGKGDDYGFTLNLFGGKLVVRANQYTTKQINSPYGQSGTFATRLLGIDFGAFNNNKTVAVTRQATLWVQAAAAARGETLTTDQVQAEVYKEMQLTADDLAAFQRLPITDISDITGKGKEIEINYNPNQFWTVKLNIAQQKAIDSNLSPALLAWGNQRIPVWQSLIDARTGKNYWTTDYGGGNGTPEQFYANQVLTPVRLAQATEGQSRPQVREYRINASTNLQLGALTENAILKRFNIGGAARWESQGAIGYYGLQQLPASITDLDPTRPIWDKAHLYLDAFVGYRTRLFHDKVGAKFQLNVRNLNEGGRLQPLAAFPDGTANSFRIIDPRQFIFSATFDL